MFRPFIIPFNFKRVKRLNDIKCLRGKKTVSPNGKTASCIPSIIYLPLISKFTPVPTVTDVPAIVVSFLTAVLPLMIG